MQFLKKHYEKILLGVVLAGLIGVLVFMLFYIAADKQAMADNENGLINAPVKALPDLDMTTNNAAMKRLETPFALDFETGNKIFNPFTWEKTADGQMVKKGSVGAHVAVVTDITPLYFILTLKSVSTNEFGARYVVGVERQASPTISKRREQLRYVSAGDKPNDVFELLKVNGPAENPDSLVLKLVDSGETVTVTHDHPYQHVDAYMAGFRYDPEKKVFRDRRAGDKVTFGGTDYLVLEVNKNELILSDQSNQKKTSLPFAP
jgi:hypothetical protein